MNQDERNAVLHALRQQGKTLKSWAEENGYGYKNASNVLRGLSRAYFGQGKEIADKLKAIAEQAA